MDRHISIIRGKLRQLQRGTQLQTIVILIPAIKAPQPSTRTEADVSWFKTLSAESVPSASTFLFEHGIVASEDFTWFDLFDKAADLLDDLLQVIEVDELKDCPIVIIAHSISGLMLKWALCLAHQRLHLFQRILSNLACIVFFGTPHSTFSDETAWSFLYLMLISAGRVKLAFPITLEISQRFSEACFGFEQQLHQTPILSLYETLETKVAVGVFRSETQILASHQRVHTDMKLETTMALEIDHRKMATPSGDIKNLSKVADFIETCIRAAQQRIVTETESVTLIPPSPTVGVTRAGTDSFSSPEDSSNLATAGTSAEAGYEIVPLLGSFVYVRPQVILPFFMMKGLSRNPNFYDREAVLNEIDTYLSPLKDKPMSYLLNNTEGIRTYSICGLGGVGKTQVAIEYAFRFKYDYEAIFWINCGSVESMSSDYAKIAEGLGLSNNNQGNLGVVSRELVKGWLAHPIKSSNPDVGYVAADLAHWLLVFDNVGDIQIIHDFWPFGSTGSVLITSRDPLAKSYLASNGTDLQPFSMEEGAGYLMKVTYMHEDYHQKEALAIAEMLGGLPLALSQMAGVIMRRQISLGEFLQMYREMQNRQELYRSKFGGLSINSGYPHTIASVWAFDQLSQEASMLLDVLCMYSPDEIPENLVRPYPNITSTGYPRTLMAFIQARTELLVVSLLRRNIETQTLSVHRLVKASLLSRMSPLRFKVATEIAVALLKTAWPSELVYWQFDPQNTAQYVQLLPHLFSLKVVFENISLKEVELGKETKLNFIKLVIYGLQFLVLQGVGWSASEPESLLQFLEHLSKGVGEDSEGAETNTMKEISFVKGQLAVEMNEPKAALQHFVHFHNATKRSKLSNDVILAASLAHLGNALVMNERYEDSLSYFRECNSILETESYFDMGLPLLYLGFALWALGHSTMNFGRLSEADDVCSEAVRLTEPPGRLMPRIAYTLGNIRHSRWMLKSDQIDADESFRCYTQALSLYTNWHETSSPRVAQVLIKLSDHHFRLKRFDAGRELLQKAMTIYQGQSQIRYAPELARAEYKMARFLQAMDGEDEVESWMEKAKGRLRRALSVTDKTSDEFTESDFDNAVVIWSR